MKKLFFWPVVFCGILAMLAMSTEKAQAELGVISGIGGNFTLTGTNGKPVSLSDFNGKVVLIFFGYTTCPDVCPTAMSTLEAVQSELGSKADQTQVILISVDPERDTQEKLDKYVGYFGEDNIGLRGTPEEIAKVAAQFRMSYKKVETDSAVGYLVDHMDFIYLIDAQGRTRSLHRSTTPVERIVSDVQSLLN
ncbi:MAG: SCO family protein [Mariprofundaceae bacterium]|nr:SCO family protein [Mariprofundaceae bacterium]